MVNLDIVSEAAGDNDMVLDEPLFPENLTSLTKQQTLCIRGAKKLEQQFTQIEIEFFKKVHQLEIEYQSRYSDLANKRQQILSGEIPVGEADVADVPIVYNLHDKALDQFTKELKDDASVKGVPHYWLSVLQNCPATSILIEEVDIPILKHLKNIDEELIADPMGLILRFHFEPNEFFENTVIEKKYVYKVATTDLYTFDGAEFDSCESTPIKWKEGKSPFASAVGSSFFSFFDKSADDEEENEDDFELAQLLRENIIPHATLYFTGELHDDDVDFGDDSSVESEDDDEDKMMEE
jgi:nucleosome assembly protein 1-like 1